MVSDILGSSYLGCVLVRYPGLDTWSPMQRLQMLSSVQDGSRSIQNIWSDFCTLEEKWRLVVCHCICDLYWLIASPQDKFQVLMSPDLLGPRNEFFPQAHIVKEAAVKGRINTFVPIQASQGLTLQISKFACSIGPTMQKIKVKPVKSNMWLFPVLIIRPRLVLFSLTT